MIEVNFYFIGYLLSPLAGLADDDDAVLYYNEMNINTEEQYREIIRKEILNYYHKLTDKNKHKTKLALSYFLTTNKVDFGRLFDSYLPPFDPPNCARDFFVWIWQELYNNENYMIEDLTSFIVVNKIHEPLMP